MNRKLFDVVGEPRGELLERLLRALGRYAGSATMVVRDDLGLDESAQVLLTRLEPHLMERKRSASWSGTTLLDDEATVLRFRFNEAVVQELVAAASGLYDWTQPSLPEDLALLRGDGTTLLGSVCHEGDAYLVVTQEEYQTLSNAVPGVAMMLCPRLESQ